MPHRRALTLIEVIVVVVIIALMLAVVLPALVARKRAADFRCHVRNVRGIQQSLILGSSGNAGYYVGVDPKGERPSASVEERMKSMVDARFVTPSMLVSPVEADERITIWDGRGPLTPLNYSYSLLQIPAAGPRREEWRDNTNTRAVIVSDRNTGTDAQSGIQSIWTDPGEWRGVVAFGDNSTGFLGKPDIDLKYGKVETRDDHLFIRAGDYDAYMIHAGNE
jgi:prepilin-type N-terminal cleavage/methylation domain-containing protein